MSGPRSAPGIAVWRSGIGWNFWDVEADSGRGSHGSGTGGRLGLSRSSAAKTLDDGGARDFCSSNGEVVIALDDSEVDRGAGFPGERFELLDTGARRRPIIGAVQEQRVDLRSKQIGRNPVLNDHSFEGPVVAVPRVAGTIASDPSWQVPRDERGERHRERPNAAHRPCEWVGGGCQAGHEAQVADLGAGCCLVGIARQSDQDLSGQVRPINAKCGGEDGPGRMCHHERTVRNMRL